MAKSSLTKSKTALLVQLIKNEPRASTWVIKDGFDVEHRALVNLLKKYWQEFEEFGEVITSPMQQPKGSKGGRPVDEYWLNEEQSIYLGALLTNTDKVREFKRLLVKDYLKLKRQLLTVETNKQNAEWLEARQAGKSTRKQETDVIKVFVKYATWQGSKNAKFYYANISKMENQALFLVEQKYPNLRDVLDITQLGLLTVADTIVRNALIEGMNTGLKYPDIYKLAKERVELLSSSHGKLLVASPIKALI